MALHTVRLVLLTAVLALGSVTARADTIQIALDRATGIYAVDETARWTLTWEGEGPAPVATFDILRGQLAPIATGTVAFEKGKAHLEARFTGPGTVLLKVKWTDAENKEVFATSGAVAAPEQIAPAAARPQDFRTFWDGKLAELRAVPANPRLSAADAGDPALRYWKLEMDNIGGTTIHAQLARPAAGERLPALLIVQWAGVYGLERGWVTDRAREGWLVLNVMPHQLPFDQPAAFYKEQGNGPLKNYWAIGNDDRETSYYLRMYLSCVRGADYLTGRGDWDGRTLVVMGGSQGGMQALVTAGLHPKISAALASVPAGCDMLGPVVGRKGGWPQWYEWTAGKDAGRVLATSRYFDVTHFAPDIRCPVLVSAGLRDEVCPPEGILATTSLIRTPKEVIILPAAGHQNENGSHGVYDARCYADWLPALRSGQPAPVLP